MIDLTALHAIMNKKGFHHFEGGSNDKGELSIYFSTGHGGRGDYVSIEFDTTDSCNVNIFKDLVETVNETVKYNLVFQMLETNLT